MKKETVKKVVKETKTKKKIDLKELKMVNGGAGSVRLKTDNLN